MERKMVKKDNFETKITNLEKIIEQLSNEDTSLEEAIKLYEDGMKLSGECQNILQTAEQKIIEINEQYKETEAHDEL